MSSVSGRRGTITTVAFVVILGYFVWNVAGQTGWFDNLGIFSSHAANNAYESGTEYLERGQYNQAIVDFDEAILLDPQYAIAYYKRGIVYVGLGQSERREPGIDFRAPVHSLHSGFWSSWETSAPVQV